MRIFFSLFIILVFKKVAEICEYINTLFVNFAVFLSQITIRKFNPKMQAYKRVWTYLVSQRKAQGACKFFFLNGF